MRMYSPLKVIRTSSELAGWSLAHLANTGRYLTLGIMAREGLSKNKETLLGDLGDIVQILVCVFQMLLCCQSMSNIPIRQPSFQDKEQVVSEELQQCAVDYPSPPSAH